MGKKRAKGIEGMDNRQRLELMWIGKYDEENRMNPEPRLLLENPAYSHAAESAGQGVPDEAAPTTDNLLIHGDNLLALKSLEQIGYAGRVKCIYIDPPYNTGAAFSHYDDNLEHSTWLSLMQPRLEILRSLLSSDGSIWISIDDVEQAYLKVLCDEIFGRNRECPRKCVSVNLRVDDGCRRLAVEGRA